MPSHDALYSSEPQVSSGELGGEEWIKDAGYRCLLHPGAGVADFESDVDSGGRALAGRDAQIISALMAQRRGDGNGAMLLRGNGLRGVYGQVHDQLLQLTGVGVNEGQSLSEVKPQLNVLGNGCMNEAADSFVSSER